MQTLKNELGIFVTCYDEVDAVTYALQTCRIYYPDAPIFLVTESNEDYSPLYSLGNIFIMHQEDTMSAVLGIRHDNNDFRLPEYQSVIKKAAQALLTRLEMAIPFLNSENIILHCPDTLIRGKLNIPIGTGLLGSTVNKYFCQETNNVLVRYGGIPITSFGAVPAIFNTSDFIKANQIFKNFPHIMDELCYSFYAIFSHDILMPILFSLIGKAETFNPDITECNRNPNWVMSNHPLVHQFRLYYPKRTAKYKINEK